MTIGVKRKARAHKGSDAATVNREGVTRNHLLFYLLLILFGLLGLHSPLLPSIFEGESSNNGATGSPGLCDTNHDGFSSILVYSNMETAKEEIPSGPFSQVDQDRIIYALITALDDNSSDTAKEHFFIDLAANHPILLSNTFQLERLGWKGICIEGNPEYWYGLARYRTCTIIGAFVGGKEDGMQADIALRGVLGGIVGDSMDNAPQKGTVKRDLVSLKTVFKKTNVPSIVDYFSLDVEGAESLIMQDFPFEEYTFRFMTVERPKPDLKALLTAHGYQFVQKLSSWGEEFWVHPASVDMSMEKIRDIVKQNHFKNN